MRSGGGHASPETRTCITIPINMRVPDFSRRCVERPQLHGHAPAPGGPAVHLCRACLPACVSARRCRGRGGRRAGRAGGAAAGRGPGGPPGRAAAGQPGRHRARRRRCARAPGRAPPRGVFRCSAHAQASCSRRGPAGAGRAAPAGPCAAGSRLCWMLVRDWLSRGALTDGCMLTACFPRPSFSCLQTAVFLLSSVACRQGACSA